MEKNKNNKIDVICYSNEYSESKLLKKISRFAKKAGAKTIYAVLILYYALFDDNFPPAQRTIIIGALGYFILPLDLLPDIAPMLGYTDDMVALLFALKTVWKYITPEVKVKARQKVDAVFNNPSEEELALF